MAEKTETQRTRDLTVLRALEMARCEDMPHPLSKRMIVERAMQYGAYAGISEKECMEMMNRTVWEVLS